MTTLDNSAIFMLRMRLAASTEKQQPWIYDSREKFFQKKTKTHHSIRERFDLAIQIISILNTDQRIKRQQLQNTFNYGELLMHRHAGNSLHTYRRENKIR